MSPALSFLPLDAPPRLFFFAACDFPNGDPGNTLDSNTCPCSAKGFS
jgi:hypothetical protein